MDQHQPAIPSGADARIVSVETFNGHLPRAQVVVVIPTYNERENIEQLLPALA